MNEPTSTMGRRDFLGWMATGAAGLVLPGVIRPAPKVFDMGRGLRRRELWTSDRVGRYLVTAIDPVCDGFLKISVERIGPTGFPVGDRGPIVTGFWAYGDAVGVGDVIRLSVDPVGWVSGGGTTRP